MICALWVRRLEPGTFEQFREAFMKPLRSSDRPDGLVRFAMVRNVDDADEVICFGLFDKRYERSSQTPVLPFSRIGGTRSTALLTR